MKNKTIIGTGISLILVILLSVILYLMKVTNDGSSIGIIGGADGPTAVYLTFNLMVPVIALASILIIACAIIFIVKRKGR